MASYLLIRHALCDPVGRVIAGRAPGTSLNREGQEQALALAARLSSLKVEAVYSSPLERAVETAQPIAQRQGLRVQCLEGLNEIDFGEWTGRTIAELEPLPAWRNFNSYRSGSRIPGGESMPEVVTRAARELEGLQRTHGPHALIAVVSHADVLRGMIAHLLGMPLDLLLRLELSPASVSLLELQDYGPTLLLLNETGGWPAELPRR